MAKSESSELSRPDSFRDYVRFLGRILGGVIREQEGGDFFQVTERIRQASVAYHRTGTDAQSSELEGLLDGLSLPDTLRFVRGFTSFSQLVNLAEDQSQRRAAHAEERQNTLATILEA